MFHGGHLGPIPHEVNSSMGKYYRERYSKILTYRFQDHVPQSQELFKLDPISFPSSFSEIKKHRFRYSKRTAMPGGAKVHQLHGKTIPT